MCTTIGSKLPLAGSAKGRDWFQLDHVYLSYDHPYHAQLQHALNIDFVNEAAGAASRIGVELPLESARALAKALQAAVDEADAHEARG